MISPVMIRFSFYGLAAKFITISKNSTKNLLIVRNDMSHISGAMELAKTKIVKSPPIATHNGIIQQYTIPYNSLQNKEEPQNLIVLNGVRSMLSRAGFSKPMWDDAAQCYVYTKNLSPSCSDPSKTPYQLWFELPFPPDASHLHEFGAEAIVRIPEKKRHGKVAARGQKCKFIGYAESAKGYKLLLEDGSTTTAVYQDVIFPPKKALPEDDKESADTNESRNAQLPIPAIDETDSEPEQSDSDHQSREHAGDQVSDNSSIHRPQSSRNRNRFLVLEDESTNNDGDPTSADEEPSQEPLRKSATKKSIKKPRNPLAQKACREHYFEFQPKSEPAPRDINAPPANPKRKSTAPERFEPPKTCFCHSEPSSDIGFLTMDEMILAQFADMQWYKLPASKANRIAVDKGLTPGSYQEMLQMENSADWIKASSDEITQLIKFGTWKLVPLPPGRKAIKCKWVFRVKRGADGEITRFKARLCACGYNQIKGVDYKAIFAPVFRIESFRMILAIASLRKMTVCHMDFTGAFLNGSVKERVYMQQPEGFVSPEHPEYVCLLLQNLYGLKQGARVWHDTVDPELQLLGLIPNAADPCIYSRWRDGKLTIVSLYVDNLSILADSEADKDEIRTTLMAKFKMTDEPDDLVLGMKMRRTDQGFFLSQNHTIQHLLEDTNMTDCHPATTPMECLTVSENDCPEKDTDEWEHMQNVPYRETVGKLIHIMRLTRPDIAYAVGVAARYMHNPGQAHWNHVKRILRYLKGTKDFELLIGPTQLQPTATTCERDTQINGPIRFSGNTDSDWGGEHDSAKSTTGYAFFIGTAPISWASKTKPPQQRHRHTLNISQPTTHPPNASGLETSCNR